MPELMTIASDGAVSDEEVYTCDVCACCCVMIGCAFMALLDDVMICTLFGKLSIW